MKIYLIMFMGVFSIFYGQLWAHEGEKHSFVSIPQTQLESINQRYLKEVKPIIEKKCFDCHGTGKELPWYAAIPGPKQLIQWDIKNAKKHFNMNKDFPFAGHGNPVEDLQAIAKSTQESTMPPLRFLLFNWDQKLSDAEKKIIIDWAKDSLQIIQDKK